MSVSKPHSEPFDMLAARRFIYGNRMVRNGEPFVSMWLAQDRERAALDEIERLIEQLEAAQKAQHVKNLESAISLAESDPLYAEVFRPYFQKIVDALASNPASEPKP